VLDYRANDRDVKARESPAARRAGGRTGGSPRRHPHWSISKANSELFQMSDQKDAHIPSWHALASLHFLPTENQFLKANLSDQNSPASSLTFSPIRSVPDRCCLQHEQFRVSQERELMTSASFTWSKKPKTHDGNL